MSSVVCSSIYSKVIYWQFKLSNIINIAVLTKNNKDMDSKLFRSLFSSHLSSLLIISSELN